VALALLYRGLQPPILLTLGEAAGVEQLLAQPAWPAQVYMNALEPHLPAFLARYDFSGDRVRPMLRMTVSSESFRPAVDSAAPLRRLGPADAPAIAALIAQGGPFAPDAFTPGQVDEGVFFGMEAAGEAGGETPPLQAVAGTHLVAPTWGVAAVGNVYVHPAQRGRGYGLLVSSAVTATLLARGLLVVLNVDQANQPAQRLYRRLGFWVHGPFVEGIGVTRNA